MSDIFISYARPTEAWAKRVADALRAQGFSVWRDEELPPHRPFSEVIEERLQAARAVVVVWSASATHSQWVRAEADFALNAAKLVQVTIDGTLPPLPFNQIHSADLSHWRGDLRDPRWLRVAESVAALIGVSETEPAVAAAPRKPFWRRPRPARWAWTAALALLSVAGAGTWLLRDHIGGALAGADTRIAVPPFDTLGPSQDVRSFADGLQDEILSVLSSDQVEAVPRTESANLRGPNARAALDHLGVGLVLDGAVGSANGSINVRLHLDDPARQTIIWSEDFERPAAEAQSLQSEVAAKATHVAAAAVQARAAGVTDPVTLGDFVAAKEHIHFDWGSGMEAAEPLLRRVIARAPRFAGGHAYLAESLASQSFAPGDPHGAEQKTEAEREAHEALRLDPKGYGAFHPLAELRPPLDWRGREALMDKAIALNPEDAGYQYFDSENLALEGRLKAAAEAARRAVSFDPLWPGPTMRLGYLLLETGRISEGLQTFERMSKLWPRHYATLSGRFWASALYGQPDAALALLAAPDTRPPDIDAPAAELWRAFLTALKSGRPDDRARAIAALRGAPDKGLLEPGPAMTLLARLGDKDGASAIAEKYVERINLDTWASGPPFLFVSQTAALRQDPRFMSLAARLGLVDYWRSTGRWPDFCAEPHLPYDCKTEAAKFPAPKQAS